MANNIGLEFAARTDTGLVRPHNEDSITISPEYGFAVLADGMGGYSAGEVASRIAVETTKQVLEEGLGRLRAQPADWRMNRSRQIQQLMVSAIQRANSDILEAAHREPEYDGMGTTIVAAAIQNDRITIAHVGDSRAYRFRNGELYQLTRDHSLLQEQIDAGLISPELARFSQNKNLVTRAVGVGPDLDVEIHEHQAEQGDVYLLCSDGLSDMLPLHEIGEALASMQNTLKQACDALVQKANNHGGEDNISVILIRVDSIAPESTGLLGRILNWTR